MPSSVAAMFVVVRRNLGPCKSVSLLKIVHDYGDDDDDQDTKVDDDAQNNQYYGHYTDF